MITPLGAVEAEKTCRQAILELPGKTILVIGEDHRQENADLIEKRNKDCKNYIYVDTQDFKNFDVNSLSNHIPEKNIGEIDAFLSEYRHDVDKGRGYSLTPEQTHDIAYLNAQNAVILENSFKLAIALAKKEGAPVEQIFARENYQKSFAEFLDEFTALPQTDDKYFPPRKKAAAIMNKIVESL